MLLSPVARFALAAFATIFLVMLAASLWLTQGHFTYSLDDPYIHLALAENLPFYHGINSPREGLSAPSSSILYPWLLTPLAHTPLAFLAPLLFNLLAGVLSVLLLVRLERQINFLPAAAPGQRAALVTAFALLINLFGLIFTGLEHTLHLVTVLAVFSGLLEIAEERCPPRWFWLAVVVGPLLRYEALALSTLALLYAFRPGLRRTALLCFALMLIGPLLDSYLLHRMGFAWLPSSVLSKSTTLTALSEGDVWPLVLLQMLLGTLENLRERTAWMLMVLLFILFGLSLRRSLGARRRQLALVALAAGGCHLLLGKFGWFDRYWAYALALSLLTILYVARDPLQRLGARLSNGHLALVLLLVAAGHSSLWVTVRTPLATRHIYEIHAQLHRFLVDDWKGPVAMFDIGYAAWHNPYPILDLYGLGSESIRRLSLSPEGAALLTPYLHSLHIDLAIFSGEVTGTTYETSWQKVATLQIPGPYVITPLRQNFFLLNPARRADLVQKLEAFRATLPPGVTLEIFPEQG